MIRISIPLIAAAVFAGSPLDAADPGPTDAHPGIPSREELTKMNAGQLFNRLCAACHKKDLSGDFGPSLIDGKWKHGSSDAEIMRTIKEGNLDLGMLPWKGKLTDAQIRSLIRYIREKEREALGPKAKSLAPEPGKTAETADHAYRFETMVPAGLENPASFALLPDGTLLIAERPGRLRIVDANGKLDPKPVADTPKPATTAQGGYLDLAIHPDFADNGWIYLSFVAPPDAEDSDSKPPTTITTITAVVRGRIKDHRWIDQETILKTSGQVRGITQGPDGALYLLLNNPASLARLTPAK